MKKYLKQFCLFYLLTLSRLKIRLLKPKIIGVCGTVGKTSTKDAISFLLKSHLGEDKVLSSKKSYNSEFGLPLTILEQISGQNSVWKWAIVLTFATLNTFFGRKYKLMVLEMGTEKPGDMDYLRKIVKPDIVVMTAIGKMHMSAGQFKNENESFEEEKKIFKNLNGGELLIVNGDDEYLKTIEVGKELKLITFGKGENADYRANNIRQDLRVLKFSAVAKDAKWRFTCQVLGEHQIYVLLPAIICGLEIGMSWDEIGGILEDFRLPPGRMGLIEGINQSLIIDSSYNSSPMALREALKVLRDFHGERKIAVLGNMNELGEYSEQEHLAIGEIVGDYADEMILIGRNAALIGQRAKEKGFKGLIRNFDDSMSAALWIKPKLKAGDILLVKGSQNGVYLERFIKQIMLNQNLADQVLVRQESYWK